MKYEFMTHLNHSHVPDLPPEERPDLVEDDLVADGRGLAPLVPELLVRVAVVEHLAEGGAALVHAVHDVLVDPGWREMLHS